MKKLMLLGFLAMQGNNVECMVSEVGGAGGKLIRRAIGYFRGNKNHFFTMRKRGVYTQKIEKGVDPGIMLDVPGTNKKISRSFLHDLIYEYENRIFDFKKIIKGPGDYRGKGAEIVSYLTKNINPTQKELLFKRFKEEIIKEETKLLNNSIKEINTEEIFDRLLKTEFKELNMRKLSQHQYVKEFIKRPDMMFQMY